ncbi:MAG: AMMECR1 protein [uncultured bacterium]|nr:MAG: AMMECR1 protein [uncultured bacterium]KKT01482.1 MAG: AMMECR1 domain-containing protein [Candidatus Peregrinibacteria bacterium GW2011_GWF2_43_17]KKT18584.1 MAG: AMMECR1 domain protein [Candidatus Peregrinibacteria bacterium GW2011_GWA2_43_8]HAU39360.1 extradiol ring-cleavage dioxygenase [Candidatus Peregrinibacteria bacterium]
MPLIGAFIVPHPPIIVPSVGGKEGLKPIEKTVKAMVEVAKIVADLKPDTVVIITPHGPVYPDRISIRMPLSGKLKGDLTAFGSSDGIEVLSDSSLGDKILDASLGVKVVSIDDEELDHGVLAPMYYLNKSLGGKYKLLSMNISFAGYKIHYEFGRILRSIFDKIDGKILFVASGDLSHALTKDAPCGFCKEGAKFDKKLVKMIEKGDVDGVLALDPFWVDDAKECGLRSVCTALGVIGESEKFKVLSYEGPYGVGYLVASARNPA